MKVKEFLENFNGDNHINIFDKHNFTTHRYNNVNNAIKDYGYYTVSSWHIENSIGSGSTLKIIIQSQF